MDAAWFGKYMTAVANNVIDREGKMRFSFMTLRDSLILVEQGRIDDVPQPVAELFRNCYEYAVKSAGPVEMCSHDEVVLILALLNCHMEYALLSGYLLKEDPSIKKEYDTWRDGGR